MTAIHPLAWTLFLVGAFWLVQRINRVGWEGFGWLELGRAWPACLFLAGAAASFSWERAPAAVVLLAQRGARSSSLQAALAAKLFPLRVVSLLEQGGTIDFNGLGDNFRVNPGEWRALVLDWILECPLVIIDLRGATSTLREELAMVASAMAGPKTACIVDSNRSFVLPAGAAAVLHESELLELLSPLAANSAPMPAPQRPLSARPGLQAQRRA